MFADKLAQRLWLFDGDDRRVEVWLRYNGVFSVVLLHRVTRPFRAWKQIDSWETTSQAAAMATAAEWTMIEQGRMP